MHYFCLKIFLLIILENIFLLFIQLTSACIYTPQHQFQKFCVCMLLVPYFSLYPIRSGGLLKPPLRNFAITHLILELHYCALVTFPQKLFYIVWLKKLIRGQGLAVKGGLKI